MGNGKRVFIMQSEARPLKRAQQHNTNKITCDIFEYVKKKETKSITGNYIKECL